MGQGLESGERGGEGVAPWPGLVDTDEQASLASGDAGGDVQQPVAQGVRFGGGELALEQGGLGPGDQVRGGQA